MNKKRIDYRIVYGAVSLILILMLYGIWIETAKVDTHHVWIQDRNLAGVFDNKVIVQLSDLHIGSLGLREQAILDILDKLQPDIIFLTGDYVDWHGDYEPALKFLSKLHAKIGIWAVMGDYDYSNSRKNCLFCHEAGSGMPTSKHSVRFLKNSTEDVHLPGGTLRIAGIDGESQAAVDQKKTLPTLPKAKAILLSHNPLNFDLLDQSQNVLMFAGDTHGGQILLPAWLFALIGYDKNALYNQGLFKQGQKQLFVSRGIGTSHLPVRLFRQPEVVVFHFQK